MDKLTYKYSHTILTLPQVVSLVRNRLKTISIALNMSKTYQHYNISSSHFSVNMPDFIHPNQLT